MNKTSNLRPAVEAPARPDQAELILRFRTRLLSEALQEQPRPATMTAAMVAMEIANRADQLRLAIDYCRTMKVRRGVLDWKAPANALHLLEIAGRHS